MLQQRRPDGACEIVPAGSERNRDSTSSREPLRDVRHQRPEGGGRTETDQSVEKREHHQIGGKTGGDVSGAEGKRAARHRGSDPEPVRQATHDDAAQREAGHGERERQRRVAARNAEIGLHRRQGDRNRPHADATDGADQHRDTQPEPRLRGFDPGVKSIGGEHGLPGEPRVSVRFFASVSRTPSLLARTRCVKQQQSGTDSSCQLHGCRAPHP